MKHLIPGGGGGGLVMVFLHSLTMTNNDFVSTCSKACSFFLCLTQNSQLFFTCLVKCDFKHAIFIARHVTQVFLYLLYLSLGYLPIISEACTVHSTVEF